MTAVTLNSLQNAMRPHKARKRVGRGPRSGMGKTCGRGHKGTKARSGAQRRFTYEGGQMRMFMKLPQRGFSQARFRRPLDVVNLGLLEQHFEDGDVVDSVSLRDRGLISNRGYGVKLLSRGKLTKKLKRIEVDAISQGAKQQLAAAGIECILTGS